MQGFEKSKGRQNGTNLSFMYNPPETSPLISRRGLHVQRPYSDSEKIRCFKTMFYNRVPKGRAAFIAFLINFLESFAFLGALNLTHYALFSEQEISSVIFTILKFTAGRVFYPVAGLIADVYLGRYKVIHIGLWLFWSGFLIILVSIALGWTGPEYSSHNLYNIPPLIAAIAFLIGSACVESAIIPFGVDQIQQGASSDELSSYFYWYYFGRNAGYIFNILCTLAIDVLYISVMDKHDLDEERDRAINYCAGGLVMIIGVTVAILLHYCLQHWYFKACQRDNPIKSICSILYFSATVKRQAPRYRRSFRYGEGKKSRIDLAKTEYDGIFSSEKVEDMKTFFRVLFIILSLGFCFITYGALYADYSMQFENVSNFSVKASTVSYDLFSIIENGLIILLIPVLNHVILPCIPGPSMKRRIGVGVFFSLLSVALWTVLDWNSHTKIKLLRIIFPTALLGIGEMLVFITALEFIYAQSPESMKSLLVGLFYSIFGIFSGVGTTIYLIFWKVTESHYIHWFYYTLLAVCGAGLVVYGLTAFFYKNRQRPTNDESEQDIVRRSFATNVYLSPSQ